MTFLLPPPSFQKLLHCLLSRYLLYSKTTQTSLFFNPINIYFDNILPHTLSLIFFFSESGVDVVISGGSVSEMAVHFIQKYGMMAFKIPSKWEHRRLTRALAAKPIMALGAVQPDELGHCDFVETKQIGGRSVTVFRQEGTVGKGK